MSTGPKLRESPDRYTFQAEGYLKRCEEKGKEPNPDYLGMYEDSKKRASELEADPDWQRNNLEWDLRTSDHLCAKVKDDDYAKKLYASLCNTDWLRIEVVPLLRQDPKQDFWSCSWRYAGGIVANMREEGDYIDWYCSGMEGYIDPEVSEDLKQLGWQGIDQEGHWA